jgi:hypothetical protein
MDRTDQSLEPGSAGKGPGLDPRRGVHGGQVMTGVIILTMGVVMFLDRTEVFGGHVWRAFPGFFLIALGLINLSNAWAARPDERSSPLSGVWLLFIGSWLVANLLNLFGLTFLNSWPLLIVGGGLMIVLKELFPGLRRDCGKKRN